MCVRRMEQMEGNSKRSKLSYLNSPIFKYALLWKKKKHKKIEIDSWNDRRRRRRNCGMRLYIYSYVYNTKQKDAVGRPLSKFEFLEFRMVFFLLYFFMYFPLVLLVSAVRYYYYYTSRLKFKSFYKRPPLLVFWENNDISTGIC